MLGEGLVKKVDLYTDGSCIGNPGPGGYACILIYQGIKKEWAGCVPDTTNNRMEITAVIEGLKKLKEPCDVTIYTDSAYTLNAFEQGWIQNWIANNWRTAGKKEVQNVDLWKTLLEVMQPHSIHWVKVKGHADNELNNRCDVLARGEIAKLQNKVD